MTAPRCTYRVQLRPGFGLREAGSTLDHLAALGVTHLYVSPVLQAAPGSMHGYDVVDHAHVSAELGGEEAFRQLAAAAHAQGLAILLDIVPNHMAIDPRNRWWWDVLENGRSSAFALYFDVSWDPPESRLKEIVLMPVLADHYGRELERGALRLARESGRILLYYGDRTFPLAPITIAGILDAVAASTGSPEAARLAAASRALADVAEASREARLARHDAKEDVLSAFARLCEDADMVAAIDREVARLNGDIDALDELVRSQHYRLAHWRTASRELDYRRFFDINELVGLRVEDPDVFAAVHERVIEWVRDGTIDGVRVDHVDGLRDPQGYLARLRDALGPDAWIVVEKILHRDERLRRSWPVDGTTGYEAIALIDRLFVQPRGYEQLARAHASFVGRDAPFLDVGIEAKIEQMRGSLAADVERVVALLVHVCEKHRRQRDHTREDLRAAIRELAAAFAVYRTYVRADASVDAAAAGTPTPEDEDRRWLDGAIGVVTRRRRLVDPELLRFLRAVLLLEVRGDVESEFVMRFQQLTAPVMAKGVEDTAFYRYSHLVAFNEVGADPGAPPLGLAAFHRAAHDRTRRPRSLVAGSTHDTKRSEDVRARLLLLAEIPDEWSAAVERWSRQNMRHRSGILPDREIEYLFYQTVVGAYPLSLERALAYMEKAAREAKRGTSWTSPDAAYERALADFVRGALGDEAFQRDLADFVRPIVAAGRITSLAQALLRLTLPGVPDIYQGCEIWDLSLVDPDNRRPVDFDARRRLMRETDSLDADAIMGRIDDGAPKLHIIRSALRVRREHASSFASAAYEALDAAGERPDHVVAFARSDVAVVLPRFALALAGEWRDTTVALPPGRWCDQLTGAPRDGGTQRVATLLDRFPVALLTRS